MTILTLLRNLIGDRDAILHIASNRHSLWIGLLFVLSAGFAREYDGEDLWHEPYHVLLPLFVSLPASMILFVFIQLAARIDRAEQPKLTHYLSFLGLFWMTAPLAWLYAIPYERFCPPSVAIDLNLATLGIVALWRVALMIRVVCVCTRIPWPAAVGVVMLFGSAAFVIVSLFTSLPLLAIMGGLRHWEERTPLQQWLAASTCLAVPAGLIWLLLIGVFARKDTGWAVAPSQASRPGPGLVALALGSVAVWYGILPITQPEQQRRHAVESAFKKERIADAAAILRAHPREAFPPHWLPPPPFQKPLDLVAEPRESELKAMEECLVLGVPEWVRAVYIKRVLYSVNRGDIPSEESLERMKRLLRDTPGGAEAVEATRKRWYTNRPPELLPPPEIER